MLWMFKPGSNQRQIEAVQYLSLFNVPAVEKLINKAVKSPAAIRNDEHKENITKVRAPEAISNAPKIDIPSALPSVPNTNADTRLNLDMLRGQAVQIERTRVKSDIEKMNEGKKLDLSLEATFDREVNRVELPECRQLLLGKSMPERMRIIQDHSKKMFCRSSM